jgi:hypothetical protein
MCNGARSILMMRHSSMYTRFFSSWHIIYINILWKGAYTRIFRLMDSWRIQTNIYTYIQNQTRERNAFSHIDSIGIKKQRISIRYYHFLICSNITIFFCRYEASPVDRLLEKYKFYQPINTDNQSII